MPGSWVDCVHQFILSFLVARFYRYASINNRRGWLPGLNIAETYHSKNK